MTSLNRRSNIFDDSVITPEKVKKYRDASVLVTPKDNDFSHFDLGLKKRRMSVPNIRDFSTPLKYQTNKQFLSNSARPEIKTRNFEIQKENISSPILRNINTNIEFSRTQESPRSQTELKQRNDIDRTFDEDQKVREYDDSLLLRTMQVEEEVIITKEMGKQNDFIVEVQDSIIQTEIKIQGINQSTQIEEEKNNLDNKEDLIKQEIAAQYSEQLESQRKQILELQELLCLREDELDQVKNQIKTLKMSFLGQLSNLREQLAQVKSEQYNNKQNIDWSLKQTIQFLIELISSNLNSYINERNNKERDNLLMYKLQVTNLKEELSQFKEFILLVIGRLKEGIAQHFEGEVKSELQKMIDNSSKGKILQLHDFFNENISITTDSSAATPRKENAPKKTPKKRHHRVDPAILEGMKYLLDHEALKNPYNSKQNLQDKLDKVLKNPDHAGLDNLVLSTLMERSTRRPAKSPAQSEMNSSNKKKTPSKRNAKTSEPTDDQISELGNSSKRIKKELHHYTSFVDTDGDKFVVVDTEFNK